MKKTLLLLFLSIATLVVSSQTKNDTVNLAELEIVSSANSTIFKNINRDIRVIQHDEIKSAPVSSIDELLRIYGGVDIRSRGPMGVQSDINLRGGTFDQGLIMINGVPLNDPQTGHHNLNQTFNLFNIDKIEIIEGSGARWLGTNSFSGGINLISNVPENNSFNLNLVGGQYGYMSINASGSYGIAKTRNRTTAGYSRSDGYTTNTDFSILNLNHQLSSMIGKGKLNIDLGLLDKGFGANSFYTPKYPNQYEHIRTYTATAGYSIGDKVKFNSNIFWRQNNDRFELFREDNNWYIKKGEYYIHGNDTAGYPTPNGLYPYGGHNYHRTNIIGADAKIRFSSALGKTSVGAILKSENILSNVLGKPMNDTIHISGSDGFFTKSDRRNYADIKLNQYYSYNRLTISAGLSVLVASDFGTNFSPGIDIGYFITEEVKIFANANQAVRLPTFTDLYYQGPTNTANPDLVPEKATSFESGLAYFNNELLIAVSGNYRKGKDIIDWIKFNPDEKWQSANLASTETFGLSVRVNKTFSKGFINYMNVSYAWLSSDKTNTDIISLYALDYLKHNLNIITSHSIYKDLKSTWTFNIQKRNGSYIDYTTSEATDYSTVSLINLKLYYQLNKFEFSLTANNLLNRSYYDIGNIKQPGIWIFGGVNYSVF